MAVDDSILPTANAHVNGHGNVHEPHSLLHGQTSSADAVHDFFARDEDEGKPNQSREDCARMQVRQLDSSAACKWGSKMHNGADCYFDSSAASKWGSKMHNGADCYFHACAQAASTIQSAAMRHLIAFDSHGEPIPGLSRKALLGRLELEVAVKRGLVQFVLSLVLFSLIVYSAVHESTAPARLGLLQTFRSIFSLDDSLADIKTLAGHAHPPVPSSVCNIVHASGCVVLVN
jgi:hypothetical protein